MKTLCSYGCGLEATHTLKNGRVCCAKSPNSCKGKRAKDSASKKGRNPFEGREHPRGAKGKDPWNKGLTKDTDERVLKSAKTQSATMIDAWASGRMAISEQALAKLSALAKATGFGGYTHRGGRGKKGRYRGIWCDSSWELAWVIYAIDHEIKFTRNTEKFPYFFNGKHLSYIPDFILETGEFIEIKGYLSEQVDAKIEHFPHRLIVIDHSMIKPYIDYAIAKFGKDFTTAYDSE